MMSSVRASPMTGEEIPLTIQPDVFEAPVVVYRVDRQLDPFRLRPPAGGAPVMLDDRPGAIFLQLLVDLPDQLLARFDIAHARLLVEEFLDLGTAKVRVVALRAAGEGLVEHDVRIVDA